MSDSPQIGKNIGQYTLLEQIGSGGMATVYRANQPKLGRDVAIKIMHATFMTDSAFITRFEREAKIVARLDHPNIVPIYDYDHDGEKPYLVMKYINGKTLKRRLNEDGALSLDEILKIIPSVASALNYAHRQGILHRDVKTSNIILDEQGTPYLMDFGLARIAQTGESSMSAEMLIGTPHYISPEQAQGKPNLDSRTDVYSLGVVLYELVVGRVPFSGDSPYIIIHKHIYTEPTPPSAIDPEIPAAVDAVILKALAKNPDDRYATTDELAQAFVQAVKSTGLSRLDASRASTAQRLREEHPSPIPQTFRGDAPAAPFAQPNSQVNIPPQGARPTPQNFNQAVDEVVYRFRDAISDISSQVKDRGFSDRIRNKAVEVGGEIQSVVESHGGARSGARIGEVVRSISVGGADTTRLIERDYGANEGAVRYRVTKEIEARRGLIAHLVTFIIVGGALFVLGETVIPNVLASALAAGEIDEFVTPLAEANLMLFGLLPWLGGLIAHGVDVWSKTGGRLRRERAKIDDAMASRYGEDWMDTVSDREYRPVRKAIKETLDKRYDFFKTFAVFTSVFTMLMVMWNTIYSLIIGSMEGDAAAIAEFNAIPPIPLIVGGVFAIILVIMGINALASPILGSEAKERAIERELAKSRAARTKLKNESKLKNEATEPDDVRLTGDGEFTESFIQEIEERRQSRR